MRIDWNRKMKRNEVYIASLLMCATCTSQLVYLVLGLNKWIGLTMLVFGGIVTIGYIVSTAIKKD